MINASRFTDATRQPLLILLAVLTVAAWAYWPGLSGDFLFDDFVNLNALGRYGGVRDLETLLFYLTSGIADPTGRPVAMASFLLDARDWPADPWPFKRTNLALHLLNGLMLYSVLAALGRRVTEDRERAGWTAFFAAALWLLSPLWVSTVLYVVQRHAMLAAFFVLAAIRVWVASREAFDEGRVTKGLALGVLAVPVIGLLAGLSKANGFLLPLMIAALEMTVLRFRAGQPVAMLGTHTRYLRLVLVWTPAAIIVVWLLSRGFRLGLDGTAGRPWTLGQRLLSQPRAIFEYLHQILIPGISARGVFADGFQVSRSWLEPWTTLPAILGAVTAIGGAILLRRRMPLLAAAVLFFVAGHAMESSTIMLELYFEHRNYLPAALIFWPLAWWAVSHGKFKRWLMAGMFAYAVLMGFATSTQAKLWGNPLALALVWAQQNPDSARAQAYAAIQERVTGNDAAAERRLESNLSRRPEEIQYALNLLDLRCEKSDVHPGDIERTVFAVKRSGGLLADASYQWTSRLLQGEGPCSQLSAGLIGELVQANIDGAQSSGKFAVEYVSRELNLRGLMSILAEECDEALEFFKERNRTRYRPEFVQSQTLLLLQRCGARFAHRHLLEYMKAGAPVSFHGAGALRVRDDLMSNYWREHWMYLMSILEEDLGHTGPLRNDGND